MNKKGMGVIIILATIMLVLPMLGANTSHAKNITWRAASRSVPSHPGAMAVEKFCKLVEERTDGALKIKFYPSEMLMPSRDQIAAVMRGTLEVANGSQSYDATAVPTINLVNMPFVGLTLQDWQPLMRPGGDLRIIMDQAYEDAGLKLLWMYPLGEQFVVTVDKPVLTVEDFKGLKLRTTGKVKSNCFKLLGAEPSAMTGGEAAEAMRKGIINGSQTTGPAILSRRYYEFARYINRWEIGPVLESLYVNKKILDALTSKTRNLVISTADEIEASMWKEAPSIREKELNILKDKGMSIISIPKKELVRSAEITQEERNKWFDKAGALGQKVKEILDKAREK